MLNRQGSTSTAQTTSTYTICFLLEATADEFKELFAFIRINKMVVGGDLVEMYESLLKCVKSFEEVYYNFSYAGAESMAKMYDSLLHAIQSRLTKKGAREAVVLMHFKNILEYLIWAMNQRLIPA